MPQDPHHFTLSNFTQSDRTRAERTSALFDSLPQAGDAVERRHLLDEIVVANLSVADAIARRYAGRGTDIDDLEQVARLALVRAVSSFRPALGHDFLSFAVPSIRGEVRRHFRDHAWTVRPPRRVQEAQLRMTPMREAFLQRQGREPTTGEYVAELGLDKPTVVEALLANDCFHPESLEQPMGGGDAEHTLADRISAHDDDFAVAEARTVLSPVFATLKPRDRLVLRLRYVEGLTQREVGERIGVTQMQVSRILQRVLEDLRCRLGVREMA